MAAFTHPFEEHLSDYPDVIPSMVALSISKRSFFNSIILTHTLLMHKYLKDKSITYDKHVQHIETKVIVHVNVLNGVIH